MTAPIKSDVGSRADAVNAVLAAANKRFVEYMRERHYSCEEAVLNDIRPTDTGRALVRAVAAWRIAIRNAAP